MNVLYLLVPLALLLAAAAVGAFYWAVRDGQFDDVETPSLRVLLHDEPHLDEARQEKPHRDAPGPILHSRTKHAPTRPSLPAPSEAPERHLTS